SRALAVDAHAKIGARQHGGDRSDRGALRRPAREIDETVVLGERQRHRSRRIVRPRRLLRRGGGGVRDEERGGCARFRDRHGQLLARLKVSSTSGACPSSVSSDTRKIDGPKTGNVTCTGSAPLTTGPP